MEERRGYFSRHWHGQLTLGIGGALTVYRLGDVFVLPPDCEHTEEVGPAGVTYVVGRKNAKG